MDKTFWIILIIIIAAYLLTNRAEGFCNGYSYAYGGQDCGNKEMASKMCRELVQSNCRIPTYPLNDCWLNEYEKCNSYCKGTNTGKMCNCYQVATEKCGSNGCPAEACYADLHQKCMAGYGFASDPERGNPSLTCKTCAH